MTLPRYTSGTVKLDNSPHSSMFLFSASSRSSSSRYQTTGRRSKVLANMLAYSLES